jgi:2-dehydro-3-deoxygluconokinase
VKVFILGEGMVEQRADGVLAYGGDALNTAVYMARAGLAPQFVSAVGLDADSESLVAAWRAEGVGLDHLLRCPSRSPGRYAIAINDRGERSFSYDRDQSAARAFFQIDGWREAFEAATRADLLYLTGITLSIFTPEERAVIVDLTVKVRARGGRVAFDPNYRRLGWPSAAAAREAIERLAPNVSIALPSIEDHAALFGEEPPVEAARRWRRLGAQEVVLKLGANGAYVAASEAEGFVSAVKPARVTDTTAAGDAFNAAYLAARLRNAPPLEAAAVGAALAAEVIGWPGAIAPRPVGVTGPAE